MKKIIALVLAVTMLFCLSGCAKEFTPNKLTLRNPSHYDSEPVVITDAAKIAEVWDYYVNLEYEGETTKELDDNNCIYVYFENTETQEYESFMVFSSGLMWFDENADAEESEYYRAINGVEVYNNFSKLIEEGVTYK